MLNLSKTLGWPQLEYFVQFWSHHDCKNMEASESVQWRLVAMVCGMKDYSYKDRLESWNSFLW